MVVVLEVGPFSHYTSTVLLSVSFIPLTITNSGVDCSVNQVLLAIMILTSTQFIVFTAVLAYYVPWKKSRRQGIV